MLGPIQKNVVSANPDPSRLNPIGRFLTEEEIARIELVVAPPPSGYKFGSAFSIGREPDPIQKPDKTEPSSTAPKNSSPRAATKTPPVVARTESILPKVPGPESRRLALETQLGLPLNPPRITRGGDSEESEPSVTAKTENRSRGNELFRRVFGSFRFPNIAKKLVPASIEKRGAFADTSRVPSDSVQRAPAGTPSTKTEVAIRTSTGTQEIPRGLEGREAGLVRTAVRERPSPSTRSATTTAIGTPVQQGLPLYHTRGSVSAKQGALFHQALRSVGQEPSAGVTPKGAVMILGAYTVRKPEGMVASYRASSLVTQQGGLNRTATPSPSMAEENSGLLSFSHLFPNSAQWARFVVLYHQMARERNAGEEAPPQAARRTETNRFSPVTERLLHGGFQTYSV